MKSIQTKFTCIIIISLLTLSAIISSCSIWIVNQVSQNDAEIMMNETCKEQTMELNNRLALIEQAVNIIYGYADGQLSTYEELMDSSYVTEYTEMVQELAIDIANQTDGSLAVYFRLNPEVTGEGTSGFFWSRNEVNAPLTQQKITDLFAYDADDVEHVGWYYIPVQSGKAIWMEPYYNKNIDVEMISYVIPFYKGDKLVGVVGMDIDFSLFVNLAQQIQLYDTGRAQLVCLSNRTIYYMKKDENEVRGTELTTKLYNNLISQAFSTELCEYEEKGCKYMLSFQTLNNQMKLIVVAPTSEIQVQRNLLILECLIVTLVVLLLTVCVAIYIAKRIIHPLRQLTEAADRFAQGDWDVSITCNTKDEVRKLTDSVVKMADTTQTYIAEINHMAYQDGLTKVKNRACYLDYVENLKLQEAEAYAVLILDVNNLKIVNDTYGHEMGDCLIKEASRHIGHTYKHSPVFRIGGDEFAVIMDSLDYEDREELLKTFRDKMQDIVVQENSDVRLFIASGMAVFPVDGESYEEVFRVADERMYGNKAAMKGGNA